MPRFYQGAPPRLFVLTSKSSPRSSRVDRGRERCQCFRSPHDAAPKDGENEMKIEEIAVPGHALDEEGSVDL